MSNIIILIKHGGHFAATDAVGTIWLGLNDLEQSKTYVWTDASPTDFTRWNNHEPNDWPAGQGLEDCVQMYGNVSLELTLSSSYLVERAVF